MTADKIEVGHLLKLKKDNAYGFEGEDLIVRVESVRFSNGYKTPWIYGAGGAAFRPSDFQGFAVQS